MEKTDEQILTEYISGDIEAIRMIYVRYKTRLFNFCLRLLGNRADAEEVTGDVFMTLITDCTYDPGRNIRFSTWIYTVARNKSVSRMRKRKYLTSFWHGPTGQDGFQEWDPPDSRDLSREELAKRELSVLVLKALDKLPFEYKEAMVLRQYHGMSYEQISVILNCSLEKVKILIFRAKEQLRVQLAPFVKEERI